LDPNSPQGQNIRPRIITCKEELAKTVLLGPVTQPLQKEMERLTADNIRLSQQVEMLQNQLAQYAAAATNAARARSTPLPGIAPTKSGAAKVAPSAPRRPPELRAGSVSGGANTNPPRPAVAGRRHTVKSGETPAAIARKYGVSLNALLKANPGLEPRRMKIGQTVNVPSQ
ncbi:MAG: LysM peptidoglycan-binding domain-containing protein, partial [Pedosphaera parvula]|nr:LysM peptidoglycan-binding domain-containing protein [Pedosphaera parvula]